MRNARRELDRLSSTAWGDLRRDGRAFVEKHPVVAVAGGAILAALVATGIRRRGLLFKTARWILGSRLLDFHRP